MFFNPIKGINRLASKGMSNINWKVTIEKNWCFQNLILSLKLIWCLKTLSPGQFLGGSNSCKYHWILELLNAT